MSRTDEKDDNGFLKIVRDSFRILACLLMIGHGSLTAQYIDMFPRVPLAQESGDNLHPDFTNSGSIYYATNKVGLAWDYGDSTQRSIGVKFWSVDDSLWTNTINITDDFSINRDPAIEFFGDSTIVVWSSNRRDTFDIMYSLNDGIRWSQPQFLSQDSVDNTHPQLSIYHPGEYNVNPEAMLVWERDNSFMWSRFTGEGWSTPQPLISDCDTVAHLVFARESQFPLIFWDGYQNDNWDIYCRYFTPDSNRWGPEFRVTTDPAVEKHPGVNESYVLRHPNSGDVYGGAYLVWQTHSSGNWDVYYAELDINDTVEINYGDTVVAGPSNTTFPVFKTIWQGDVGDLIVLFQSDQLGFSTLWLQSIWFQSEPIPLDTLAPSRSLSVAVPALEELRYIHYWFGWEHQNASGNWEIWGMDWISFIGAVEPEPTPLPKAITLAQNYPNPFNSRTVIPIMLSRDVEVSVTVYNLRGELVKTIQSGLLTAGEHNIIWDGLNRDNTLCHSGVYFVRIQSRYEQYTQKVVLLK